MNRCLRVVDMVNDEAARSSCLSDRVRKLEKKKKKERKHTQQEKKKLFLKKKNEKQRLNRKPKRNNRSKPTWVALLEGALRAVAH
jgi:hypothetical protein